MAFLCFDCHAIPTPHSLLERTSRGPCEHCGEVGFCFDCQCKPRASRGNPAPALIHACLNAGYVPTAIWPYFDNRGVWRAGATARQNPPQRMRTPEDIADEWQEPEPQQPQQFPERCPGCGHVLLAPGTRQINGNAWDAPSCDEAAEACSHLCWSDLGIEEAHNDHQCVAMCSTGESMCPR